MSILTRFAPSPTGPLHLGHAYAAAFAADLAGRSGGTFLVRIEDIDRSRARPHWEAAIFDDLTWLGLAWQGDILRQSERQDAYQKALQTLWDSGLLYPCDCRRRDIEAALSAPQEGVPLHGPDGLVYPGLCRPKPRPHAMPSGVLRLDLAEALRRTGPILYHEVGSGQVTIEPSRLLAQAGDFVVARRDMGTSYHLSVVVDDAAQGITDVSRGEDLRDATPLHVVLQRLLGLPTPRYHHHRLIRDETGKRLAKRDDARALATLRDTGWTRADVYRRIGLQAPVITAFPG